MALESSLSGLLRRARTLRLPSVASPSFFLFLLGVSVLLFARHPATNFVYDEQEALLANPFLNSGEPLHRAFSLDFWGLPPERTIGSYRPLVSLVWKSLAFTLTLHTPYYFSIANLLFHALCAREVGVLVQTETSSEPSGRTASLLFISLALSTEAVSGVVGLADILVTYFALLTFKLALANGRRRELALLFLFPLFGFFSKETMIGALPVLALALLLGRRTKLEKVGGLVCLVASLVASVLTRKVFFPAATRASDAAFAKLGGLGAILGKLVGAFAQPNLPVDPINNPLLDASLPVRFSTASELYARSFLSIFAPLRLSGDYSFSETIPHGLDGYSLLGGAILLGLAVGAIVSFQRGARLCGLGLVWVLSTSLPTANFLLLLPTVRAERLWYLPCAGLVVACTTLASKALAGRKRLALALVLPFFLMQATFARLHANDYRDDVAFWRATAKNAPRSAKAHLNLGVMLGARGDSAARVEETRLAVSLAPKWPMAHVYLGDILCRLDRLEEAYPHYLEGFRLGPDQKSLIALGLQCLWDKGAFSSHADELTTLGSEHPGSWLAYLVSETVRVGDENQGIPKQYRPRGYNERGVSGKRSQ